MKFDMDELMNRYFKKTKKCTSLELESNGWPYVNCDGALKVRSEYVTLCLQSAQEIWNRCNLSKELIVVYEDKYSCHQKGEKAFVENCLKPEAHFMHHFKWQDEGENYNGTRYIWHTTYLDYVRLFTKIILSDLGEETELDCAVYIIDKQSENIFFLYDDRGIDLYFSNDDFIENFNKNK